MSSRPTNRPEAAETVPATPDLKRMTLEVPADMHLRLKYAAAVQETTMRELVIEATREKLAKQGCR